MDIDTFDLLVDTDFMKSTVRDDIRRALKKSAAKDKRISALKTTLSEQQECYRKWGILPCPSCQSANERIVALEIDLKACAEALDMEVCSCYDEYGARRRPFPCLRCAALDRPGVQAVLAP